MKQNWSSYIQDLSDFPEGDSTWEKQFMQTVLSYIPKDNINKVLEVGCSNGRWLRWFNKEYKSAVFGVDNDSTGFKKDDIISFASADALNLPYDSQSFDLVFSLGLVEHFRKGDKLRILKEQCRVLKKKGYLICQTPKLDLSLNYLYMKIAYDLRQGTRHFITTPGELSRYIKELGLEIIFNSPIGCLREIEVFKKIKKVGLFSKLFSTETLIIARKI